MPFSFCSGNHAGIVRQAIPGMQRAAKSHLHCRYTRDTAS
jgi:hypothetical protein